MSKSRKRKTPQKKSAFKEPVDSDITAENLVGEILNGIAVQCQKASEVIVGYNKVRSSPLIPAETHEKIRQKLHTIGQRYPEFDEKRKEIFTDYKNRLNEDGAEFDDLVFPAQDLLSLFARSLMLPFAEVGDLIMTIDTSGETNESER